MHVDFECPVCGKKHQWSYPEIAGLAYWKGCDWFWCDSCQAEMRLGLEKRNDTVTLDLLHIPAAKCWQWVDMAVEEVIETHGYEWEKEQAKIRPLIHRKVSASVEHRANEIMIRNGLRICLEPKSGQL